MLTLQKIKQNNYTDSARHEINHFRAIRPALAKSSDSSINFKDVNFEYTNNTFPINYLEDIFLTKISMHLSEKSLKEDWENEDDERWNSF